jgi:hypothetical protein
MRFQGLVLAGQAVVFGGAAIVYITGGGSLAGFIMLASAVVFGVWLAVFLLRRGESDDGTARRVVGTFPVGTTRAPLLAAAIVLFGNGLVVGWWMVAVSAVILLVAAVLYFFEYLETTEPSEDPRMPTDQPPR